MKIGKVMNFGIWDSKIAHPYATASEDRPVNFFEIEYMISGNGSVILDGLKNSDLPNCFLIAKPGQKKHSEFHYKTYYIHIDVDPSIPYYNVLTNAPNFFRIIDHKSYARIMSSLISILFDGGGDTDSLQFNAKFYELLYHVQKDSCTNERLLLSKRGNAVSEKIKAATNFINERFTEKITLKNVANAVNYTPNYLQHVFKENLGISPYGYILKLRIKKAKKMIATESKTLAEIAYACGFSSQSYFTLIFRKQTNLTPAEYRKSILGNYLP